MTAEIRKVEVGDPLLIGYPIEPNSSEIWAGFWQSELAAIWGIVPVSLLSDTAFIWSIGTPVLRQCPKTFLRVTREWIRTVQQEYPILMGCCDHKTTLVKHLGAVFTKGPGDYDIFTIGER